MPRARSARRQPQQGCASAGLAEAASYLDSLKLFLAPGASSTTTLSLPKRDLCYQELRGNIGWCRRGPLHGHELSGHLVDRQLPRRRQLRYQHACIFQLNREELIDTNLKLLQPPLGGRVSTDDIR